MRGAFSLVEVLIVLALLVILAGFAWPALETQIVGAELPESASHFRDTLFMARSEAIKENRRIRIRFEPEKQQPIIEIEIDPIEYANEWEPVKSAWAEQAMESLLLADVQVHRIKPGRPEFTKPISINDNPELDNDDEKPTLKDEEIGALDTDDFYAILDDIDPKSAMADSEYPVDEDRPVIQFDPHGNGDWALITIARKAPGEELEDEDPAYWILLDGRTGLATIREPISEDDKLNPDNYVKRENLYLPDLSDLGRLSFKSTGFGGQPAVDEDGDGVADVPVTDGTDSGAGDGLGDGAGTGSGDSDIPDLTDSDLDRKLDDSGLSEAEQNNIRNALNGGGGRRNAGRGGDGKAGAGVGGRAPTGGRAQPSRGGGNR